MTLLLKKLNFFMIAGLVLLKDSWGVVFQRIWAGEFPGWSISSIGVSGKKGTAATCSRSNYDFWNGQLVSGGGYCNRQSSSQIYYERFLIPVSYVTGLIDCSQYRKYLMCWSLQPVCRFVIIAGWILVAVNCKLEVAICDFKFKSVYWWYQHQHLLVKGINKII